MKYFLKSIRWSSSHRRSFPKLSKTAATPAPRPVVKAPEQFYPTDVKSDREKTFYRLVDLKPVGEASKSLLQSNGRLRIQHWERVKEFAKKNPLKATNKKEVETWVRKAIMTPEQEVVMWYEASLKNPLSHEGYAKYMMAFEKVVGKDQFKRLMGGDAVQVVKSARKQEREMMKRMGK